MAGKEVTLVFEDTPVAATPVKARVYDPSLSIWPNPPEGQAPIPSHPICLPGMGCWETLPPIEELPSYKAGWNMQNDGWYFYMGPLDKPRPPGEGFQLDPMLTYWRPGIDGWWLVSGPYDKPRPVFGVDPPEPPTGTEPLPPGSTSKWVWTGAQWALVTFTVFPPDVAQPKKPK